MPSYHLWLMPFGEAYPLLAATIAELSRRHGAPIFEPHVTLLGDLPGSEEEIVPKVQETSAVMEANIRGKRIFNQPNDPPYRPHLSLLYGSYPVSLKARIIADLPSFQGVHFAVTTLHLIRAESTNPKEWHRIHAFPLSG